MLLVFAQRRQPEHRLIERSRACEIGDTNRDMVYPRRFHQRGRRFIRRSGGRARGNEQGETLNQVATGQPAALIAMHELRNERFHVTCCSGMTICARGASPFCQCRCRCGCQCSWMTHMYARLRESANPLCALVQSTVARGSRGIPYRFMKPTLAEAWREISPYLDVVLDLEGEARAAWLADLATRRPE